MRVDHVVDFDFLPVDNVDFFDIFIPWVGIEDPYLMLTDVIFEDDNGAVNVGVAVVADVMCEFEVSVQTHEKLVKVYVVPFP
ncbi:hypothetical protein NDU88_003387 [Pleurodeles waltl]|uniref:Uncharacterized protein n=1 Tax=Pleurodeles waltl TaxID=8319 RepID=A0AAV7TPL5_PLEWA|nr:hypothetical protein NDU88_003387 [Pleurodeles waltl]